MLPINSASLAAYQNFVAANLCKYYPDPDSLPRSAWDVIQRFWNLDLSYTAELLWSKTPSYMQRSYLLSIDFKGTFLTDWAAQLKINPLYAILSSFEFGDTPGIGIFYNFITWLWESDSDNLSPHIHPIKIKRSKSQSTIHRENHCQATV